ncbi:MAG: hypothetical protein V1834_02195 [Candidatus Micrarchaeota archaeon]
MEEKDLQTSVDRLIELISSKKRVTVSEASQALALPVSQVEKLARILEESKLIKVEYGLTNIFLEADVLSRNQASSKQGLQPLTPAERLGEVLMGSAKMLSFAHQDLIKRLQAADEALAELENTQQLTASQAEKTKKEIDALLKELADFKKNSKDFEEKEGEFEKHVSSFKKRLDSALLKHSESKPSRKSFFGGLRQTLFPERKKPVQAVEPVKPVEPAEPIEPPTVESLGSERVSKKSPEPVVQKNQEPAVEHKSAFGGSELVPELGMPESKPDKKPKIKPAALPSAKPQLKEKAPVDEADELREALDGFKDSSDKLGAMHAHLEEQLDAVAEIQKKPGVKGRRGAK